MHQEAGGTNRYRIISKLCSGGMADIFLGIQLDQQVFDRLVVIKKIHRVDDTDSELSKMFADEARIISTLSHPHIVQIFDFTEGAEAFHIIMEYIDGENLGYILSELRRQNIRMPLPIVFRLMEQALEALQYIHTAAARSGEPLQIIHRDLDPRNLMMDSNGYLKIIDFGVAKAVLQTELTAPGLFKGKLSHVAPEMFTQTDIDHRADIYSIGLVLYEMVTGDRPFRIGKSAAPAEAIRRITQEPIPAPSTLRPDIAPELEAIILKACAKDREQRYQSAEALQYAISCIAHGDAYGLGIASNAAVKMWFRTLFDERLAKRRVFENKTLEKARMSINVARSSRPSSPPPILLENDRGLFSSAPGDEYSQERRISGLDTGSSPAFNTSRSGRIAGPSGNNWSVPPSPAHGPLDSFRSEPSYNADAGFGKRYFWKVAATTAFLSLAVSALFIIYWNEDLPFFSDSSVADVETVSQNQPAPGPVSALDVPQSDSAAQNNKLETSTVENAEPNNTPAKNNNAISIATPASAATNAPLPEKKWTWSPEKARKKKQAEKETALASLAIPVPNDPYETGDDPGKPQKNESTAPDSTAASADETLPDEAAAIEQLSKPSPNAVVPPPSSPSAPQPSRLEEPGDTWLSGNGDWNGAVAVRKGCGSCHTDLKATAKTASQWSYFFSHNRHRQHADLKKLFSKQELRQVESHLISNTEQNKQKSSGIAGVR